MNIAEFSERSKKCCFFLQLDYPGWIYLQGSNDRVSSWSLTTKHANKRGDDCILMYVNQHKSTLIHRYSDDQDLQFTKMCQWPRLQLSKDALQFSSKNTHNKKNRFKSWFQKYFYLLIQEQQSNYASTISFIHMNLFEFQGH